MKSKGTPSQYAWSVLAFQPCEDGEGELVCITCHPWIYIDWCSWAIKSLSTNSIKIITAHGALIISIIPVTCHGSSVFSLRVFWDHAKRSAFLRNQTSRYTLSLGYTSTSKARRKIKKRRFEAARDKGKQGMKAIRWVSGTGKNTVKAELSSLHIASAEPS